MSFSRLVAWIAITNGKIRQVVCLRLQAIPAWVKYGNLFEQICQIVSFIEGNSNFVEFRLQILFRTLLAMKTGRVVKRVFARAIHALSHVPIVFGFLDPLKRALLHTSLCHDRKYPA